MSRTVATPSDAEVPGNGTGPTREPASEPWPSAGRAWYSVFVFALVLMVTFLDRGILNILVEPIKLDLHLTDLQMSLLMGFAFVAFYMVLGLPIARLVDYRSRRKIIGAGLTIWSLTTVLFGLARSFGQLFLCRIGAGVGEACGSPAIYSMLADLFPREKLARAIAVLNFGSTAGVGLSLIVGGTLATHFLQMPAVTLPVVGALRGWQLTFIAVGLPGLLVAALMITVSEPRRRGRLAPVSSANPDKPVPIPEMVAFVLQNARVFGPLLAGMGIQTVMAVGLMSWTAAFYMRRFHWTPAQYGSMQAALSLTVLPLGGFVGSLISEHFAKKYDDANMRTVLIAFCLSLPANILSPLMPNATMAVVLGAWAGFSGSWCVAPMNAALQIITPNQMRGQMTALSMFVFNVLGTGLGPVMVALATQFVFHSDAMLGRSMALTAAFLGPLGVLAWAMAIKPYGRAVERTKAWS